MTLSEIPFHSIESLTVIQSRGTNFHDNRCGIGLAVGASRFGVALFGGVVISGG